MNERIRTWGVRLLALGLAIGLWLNASLEDRLELTERLIEASVSYNRPRSFVIMNQIPTVNVRLQGNKKTIRQLNPVTVNVQVELAQREPGVYTINLSPENVLRPEGLTVVSIEPNVVRVELQREITQRLPVVPKLVGKPNGPMDEPEVFPNQVLVAGPEPLVTRVGSLTTRPIDLTGQSLPFEITVPVDPPDPLIQVVQPSQVTVRIPPLPPPEAPAAQNGAPPARRTGAFLTSIASERRPRLFGTDGVRGRFGEFPLDRATVTALAAHLADTLRQRGNPSVVLGGDTRESTPEICRWLAEGLIAGGVSLRYAGVIPTPGIAFLTRLLGAGAGVVVSSHNPYPDNGIKLLDPQGFKWSDDEEEALERRLDEPVPDVPEISPDHLQADDMLRERYLRHLAATVATVPGERPLDGLRIVLDAGNGAASSYAGEIFARLGARVTLLHAAPNGRNVNEGCGSTAPEEMAARVVSEEAGLGAAFDGDADRCILADERGTVHDGDAILYLWATCLRRSGRLEPPKIVATSMSNLGLERALDREGIGLVRCNVGDRYVVEAMRRDGILLGGEQSGHIVQMELASTGDGLLTAVQMAALAHQNGCPLSEQLAGFRRYPQILLNVRVARKADFSTLPKVVAAQRHVEESLGADGRLVLRYSGTEPLARVMIEGPDQETVEALAGELAEAIRQELG